jgi:pimeloyl-ACP methyl ester carboxylesterase
MTTTLLLVHGGTVTSTMWDPVLPYLRTPALAVDLPGRRYNPADLGKLSRSDWVSSVVAEIVARGLDRVVLVGHSSAGYVIPEVAAGVPDHIAHLVFVAATVPADGMRPVDYIKPRLRDLAVDNVDAVRAMAAGKTLGGLRPGRTAHRHRSRDSWRTIPGWVWRRRDRSTRYYDGWSRVPPDVPKTFIRCTQDRVVKPELVDVMLGHMGEVDVREMDAGHGVASESPEELARLLDEIADTVL